MGQCSPCQIRRTRLRRYKPSKSRISWGAMAIGSECSIRTAIAVIWSGGTARGTGPDFDFCSKRYGQVWLVVSHGGGPCRCCGPCWEWAQQECPAALISGGAHIISVGQKATMAASTAIADTAAGLRISYLIALNLPTATIPPFPPAAIGAAASHACLLMQRDFGLLDDVKPCGVTHRLDVNGQHTSPGIWSGNAKL
jgi:hypothetical protein